MRISLGKYNQIPKSHEKGGMSVITPFNPFFPGVDEF